MKATLEFRRLRHRPPPIALDAIRRPLVGAQELVHGHWHQLAFHFVTVPVDASQQRGSIVVNAFHKKLFKSCQIGSTLDNLGLVLDEAPGAEACSDDSPPSEIDSVTAFVELDNLFRKIGRRLGCRLVGAFILAEDILDGLRGDVLRAR